MSILLGLTYGTGIDLIRSARQRKPDVDIMVVTVFGDEQHVVSSIEAGATGYILKDSTPADVISCIRLLRAGGSPVSPVVARSVLRAIRSRMGGATGQTLPPRAASSDNNPLSARETEILQLLAKGMSFNEIGEILGISPHTVTAHIKKIYRKLAVHSRGEAVYEASQMGLLKS
jgi:DNA-binding NarL/FixJ family response regulator